MNTPYILKSLEKMTAVILIGIIINCTEKYQCVSEHSYSAYEATVAINSIRETTKILHIADSHISIFDEREKEYHPYSKRMDHAYTSVPHYETGETTTPVEAFSELMDLATSQHVNAIVLTGDIINNPSKASVKFILDSVHKTGIPFIYVAGNHDWHYEGMKGSMETLRQIWTQNCLLPLYGGRNHLYSSNIIGGINFVSIDNSTYQVNEEQLRFYIKQTKRALPIVLLMHIPLYLKKDAESDKISTCGDSRWGWDMDKNYKIEQRERWFPEGNLPSTMEFVEAVKKSPNLVAILVGHTHRARADKISQTAFQYITGRSADGQHRLITFEPLIKSDH